MKQSQEIPKPDSLEYRPTLEELKMLSNQGNLIPVYCEIKADMETPVSAYLKVARPPYSFLLESVEGGERLGRYSFIGTEPYNISKTGTGQPSGPTDPLVPLQDELNKYKAVNLPGLPRFHGGAVGYLSYDVIRYFEPRVPTPASNPLKVPESLFMFTDTLLIFDHLKHTIKVVSHVRTNEELETEYAEAIRKINILVNRLNKSLDMNEHRPSELSNETTSVTSNFTKESYLKAVGRAKEYVFAGDVIQVVLSQRLKRSTNASPFQIYRALRTINPSPYMYYLDLEGFQIIGASPEMLLQVEDGKMTTHPIAGTRPRGISEREDLAMEDELKASEKERAEHIMLVDLARNDIGRVSLPGTVDVTRLMGIDRYSHVMHLVSHVTGELRPELNIYDAMRSTLPAGTLSGSPKIRAMEIISELEQEQRGPYSGAVGYFGFSGNVDTALTIRTILLKDGIAYLQAGGGIVADSIPEDEYQETLHKAGALMKAIDKAEGHE